MASAVMPPRLVAIDPGNRSGVAKFMSGHLIYAVTVDRDTPREWAGIVHNATHCVVELPQIYRPRHSKGNPNDLVPLIMQCGWLESFCAMHEIKFTAVQPRSWKGQLPKDVVQTRMMGILTPEEKQALKGLDHNAYDAIGIGLSYLGRLKI